MVVDEVVFAVVAVVVVAALEVVANLVLLVAVTVTGGREPDGEP